MTDEDEALVARIRPFMKRRKGYSEKKMFGGVCFMINGNMCVGPWKGSRPTQRNGSWPDRSRGRVLSAQAFPGCHPPERRYAVSYICVGFILQCSFHLTSEFHADASWQLPLPTAVDVTAELGE
jgi:hypothetical protein